MSIPGIMVAIVIIAILGPGLHRAMIALGILFSTSFLRLARGVVLTEREEVYVKSARVVGASDRRILLRHIFPNIAPPLIVQVTLTVGAVLLAEAGLSFIGLGVQPPQCELGDDAQHGGKLHGTRLVPGHSARHRDRADGAVGQSARRRPARFDRPRHRGRGQPGRRRRQVRCRAEHGRRRLRRRCRSAPTTSCASKACRCRLGEGWRRGPRHHRPVLQHRERRDAGAGRRIRQRQDDDRACRSWA